MTSRWQAARALPAVPATALAASAAHAHGGEAAVALSSPARAPAWSADPLSWALLTGTLLVYAAGLGHVWRTASARRRPSHLRDAACFAAGWVALAVALLSPLHELGSSLFSAHMVQHELLMLVAAPLLVLGRPLGVLSHAVAGRWLVAAVLRLRAWRAPGRAWRIVTTPLAAWAIHAAALWIWHLPKLFEATLASEAVHTLQHASFFGSALLFWWALLRRRTRTADYGAGVLYLFTTSLHSGALGALLALAGRVLYPSYAVSAPAWGLVALEDQQLGGLLMWIPAGTIYAGAALALLLAWIRDGDHAAGAAATTAGAGGAP